MGGRRIGAWKISEHLGSGGFGSVYLANHEHHAWQCAIKVLRDESGSINVARFHREARLLAEVDSNYCVRIMDFGHEGGLAPFWWIRMPFIDGKTITRIIREEHPIPEERVVGIARQVSRAIDAIHGKGIVHRDLKPGNVMSVGGPSGDDVKVLDFGIAKLYDEPSDLTESGRMIGTRRYVSPEQAMGQRVDPRSDLFSLGTMIYALATGEVPFANEIAVCRDMPALPGQLRPDMSRELEYIIMKLLQKRPADRYQSARELESDLAGIEELSVEVSNDSFGLRWFGKVKSGVQLRDLRARIARDEPFLVVNIGDPRAQCQWEHPGGLAFRDESMTLGDIARYASAVPLRLVLAFEFRVVRC